MSASEVVLNAPVQPGGQSIATDLAGSKEHQYVKMEFGADGTQTPVSAAAPLPVTNAGVALAANQLADGHNVTVDNASLVVAPPLIATSPANKVSVTDAAATTIVAANAARDECLLFNAGTGTVYIAVGETATSSSMPLLAGAAGRFRGVGIIAARNDTGGAIDIHYMDETR